jgi:hypothetical protein
MKTPIQASPTLRGLKPIALGLAICAASGQAFAATNPTAPLDLGIAPVEADPQVGLPIHFSARSNRDCYLYLYETDPASGTATFILPNRQQPDNRLTVDRAQTVPGPSSDYIVDKPGVRTITAVASTRPLEVQSTAARDLNGQPVAGAKDLASTLASKGLGSAANSYLRVGDDELLVRRFDLQVTDRPPSQADETNPLGVAFVAAAGHRYRVGETLRVVFGADRQGWVHLYVIEPNGKTVRLARRETDGRTVQSVRVLADAPAGEHTLVAVHTLAAEFDERQLDPFVQAGQSKGLRLIPDDLPATMAVQTVTIVQ